MTCRRAPIAGLLIVAALAAGCASEQSAFSGEGVESARTLTLTWILFGGGALILALVCGLTALALFGGSARQTLSSERLVVVGGIVFPAVVLTVLLFYGYALLGAGAATGAAADGPLRITVEGNRWWWRVTYHTPDGDFDTANELRIPVGEPIALELTSADVIHSFWVPAYAGKIDMIPGRTNTLTLEASRPGLRRGQCAEYCGGPHAFMSFYVEALDAEAFTDWLASERGDAVVRDHPGADAFRRAGCGACHAIRGTDATGRVGPDLTHVGSRHSLGAGLLANEESDFRAWIERHQELKPENLMPEMATLDEADIDSLASYLAALK